MTVRPARQETRVQQLDGVQERLQGVSRPAGKARHHIALYGKVAIERARCPECGAQSFVRSGTSVCCDAVVSTRAAKYRRETEPPDVRKRPPLEAACHICNALKYNLLFQTEDDARVFLADRRRGLGYDW